MAERGRDLPGVSFIRALIPFLRALSSFPNHLPKPHLPIPSPWGLRFQHISFGRYKHSDHSSNVYKPITKGRDTGRKGGNQSPNLLRNEGFSGCGTFVAKIKTVLDITGIHFSTVNFFMLV